MTTWEIPEGYGRVKPDLLAIGENVQGSRVVAGHGCRSLSGTSVSSPVVSGAVALLVSCGPLEGDSRLSSTGPSFSGPTKCGHVPSRDSRRDVNVASVKQVLLEGATRLSGPSMFEQGAGKLNLTRSLERLLQYEPHVSCFPATLDLTECPYAWPFCSQPLFHGALPVVLNVTLINGLDVLGEIVEPPRWQPHAHPDKLLLSFDYSRRLWPWSGYLAIYLSVPLEASRWSGTVEGLILLTVQSGPCRSVVNLPLKVQVVPTPPRSRRVLWDQFHSLHYPTGYFPRDQFGEKEGPFDWNGDHLHTNYHLLYNFLRERGFFLEVLGTPLTCFNASQYGTLLIVDPEEEFFSSEIRKLKQDIERYDLSLAIIADWYSVEHLERIQFYDQNTLRWWTPVTGGSNVPALNDLLADFGIAFGGKVYSGELLWPRRDRYQNNAATFASGTSIIRFPAGGTLWSAKLSEQSTVKHSQPFPARSELPAVLGFYPTVLASTQHERRSNESTRGRIAARTDSNSSAGVHPTNHTNQSKNHRPIGGGGRLAVFTDSTCLDDNNKGRDCFWILEQILHFTGEGIVSERLPNVQPLREPFISSNEQSLPSRLQGNDLPKYSKVIKRYPMCKQIVFQHYNSSVLRENIDNLRETTAQQQFLVFSSTEKGEYLFDKQGDVSVSNGKFREQSILRTYRYSQESLYGTFLYYWILSFMIVVMIVISWRRRIESKHRAAPIPSSRYPV